MRANFVERRGKIEQMDRSYDLKFWQAQPARTRFNACWELIIFYMKAKRQDVRQLRLQRSFTNLQRQKS